MLMKAKAKLKRIIAKQQVKR